MPVETPEAIAWALTQTVHHELDGDIKVTKDTPIYLVDKVREYFNSKSIQYVTFSYDDLVSYFEE